MSMEIAAIVGVLSVPTIVAFIQFLKKVTGLTGNVWLLTSFILGVASQALAAVAAGSPVDLGGWLALVGIGVVGGLAASKAYDETLGKD